MRVNQAAARTQATCASWTRDRRAFLPQRRCRCQNRPETAAGTAREGQKWDVSGIVSGIASASDSGSIPSARALLYLPPRPLLPSSQPPFPLCRNQWVLPHPGTPPLSSSTIYRFHRHPSPPQPSLSFFTPLCCAAHEHLPAVAPATTAAAFVTRSHYLPPAAQLSGDGGVASNPLRPS